MIKKTLWWKLKRKKWQAKRKWRLVRRKWRASSIKLKVFTLSIGLLCLLVFVLLGAILLAPHPPTNLEATKEILTEVTECLKDGNAEAMKVLLSAKSKPLSDHAKPFILGPDSVSSGKSEEDDEDEVLQLSSQRDVTGRGASIVRSKLIDNFDKVQELARTGKVHVFTKEKGDIVFGNILINSPRGMYHLRVKLKKIDGKWVIVE